MSFVYLRDRNLDLALRAAYSFHVGVLAHIMHRGRIDLRQENPSPRAPGAVRGLARVTIQQKRCGRWRAAWIDSLAHVRGPNIGGDRMAFAY